MDRITITGMEFYGYHGCLPSERTQGQTFFVDAELFLDLSRAGQSDDLAETVDYAQVFESIQKLAEGEPRQLIEALAESVARQLLADFPKIQKVVLTVHKPLAPISGKFRDVFVTLERDRVSV